MRKLRKVQKDILLTYLKLRVIYYVIYYMYSKESLHEEAYDENAY
jgi:hypothetical protein